MKILHIIDSLEMGGAQRVLYNVLKDNPEFEHQVLCLQGRNNFSDIVEAVAPVHYLDDAKYNLLTFWKARQFIFKLQPDLVETWLVKSSLVALLLRLTSQIPIVIAHHSGLTLAGYQSYFPTKWMAKVYLQLFFWLLKRVAAVIVVTQDAKDYMHEIGLPNNIYVISNGIDPDLVRLSTSQQQAARVDFRQALNIADDATVILQLARLHPVKNPMLLLEAFSKLSEQEPKCVLCFVGNGPLHGWLSEQIIQLNLQGKVILAGYREDVAHVLAGSDITTLTSNSEAFGLAVLEGWAMRLPVVSTACSGPQAIIHHGENGLLVPIGDADALAGALLQLVRNTELRKRLGEAGYRSLMEKYTLEKMQTNYNAVYRLILD